METNVTTMTDKELVQAYDELDTITSTDEEWNLVSQEMAKRSIQNRRLPVFMFD